MPLDQHHLCSPMPSLKILLSTSMCFGVLQPSSAGLRIETAVPLLQVASSLHLKYSGVLGGRSLL